jgi:hypothetical protein
MPVTVMIGILALIIALVLYTVAVWQAFRSKGLKPKQLYFLWIGFAFDVLATATMAIEAGGIQHDLHTIIAFVGMFGMLAAAIIGTWAHSARKDGVLAGVAKWIAVPWVAWVAVFVWGFASRGPGSSA